MHRYLQCDSSAGYRPDATPVWGTNPVTTTGANVVTSFSVTTGSDSAGNLHFPGNRNQWRRWMPGTWSNGEQYSHAHRQRSYGQHYDDSCQRDRHLRRYICDAQRDGNSGNWTCRQ